MCDARLIDGADFLPLQVFATCMTCDNEHGRVLIERFKVYYSTRTKIFSPSNRQSVQDTVSLHPYVRHLGRCSIRHVPCRDVYAPSPTPPTSVPAHCGSHSLTLLIGWW